MYDHRKKRRVFHVNMLKQWYVLTNTGYTAEEVPADHVDEDIPIWKDSTQGGSAQVAIAERLNSTQRAQLQNLLEEYEEDF